MKSSLRIIGYKITHVQFWLLSYPSFTLTVSYAITANISQIYTQISLCTLAVKSFQAIYNLRQGCPTGGGGAAYIHVALKGITNKIIRHMYMN